ncbi:MAG: hypothetical protein LBM93_11470 [Oscillospiraceae bacterium]|jgi:hypothetical protein|nr:hypothetical protein [Oscillospiraceae bacterium]
MTNKKLLFIKNKKFWINIFLFIPFTFIFDHLFLLPFDTWESYGIIFALVIEFGILLWFEIYLNKTFLKTAFFSFLTASLCFWFFLLFLFLGIYLPGQKNLTQISERRNDEYEDLFFGDWSYLSEIGSYLFLSVACLGLLIIAIIVYSIKKKGRKSYDYEEIPFY